MKVLIATAKDISTITDLLNQTAELLHAKNLTQWGEKFPQADIQNEIAKRRVYQVVSFGKIVAVFSLRDSDYFWHTTDLNPACVYFYRFALAKHKIGKNIGSVVYRAIEKFIVLGLGKSVIRLDCWAGNTFLKKFYESHQFIHQGDFPESDYQISLYEKQFF